MAVEAGCGLFNTKTKISVCNLWSAIEFLSYFSLCLTGIQLMILNDHRLEAATAPARCFCALWTVFINTSVTGHVLLAYKDEYSQFQVLA